MVSMTQKDRSLRPANTRRGNQRQHTGTQQLDGFAGRAIYAVRRGGPDVLQVRERQVPFPEAGEIVVEIRAAGVAFGDQMLREGLIPGLTFPAVPGYDGAGVVVAVGPGVTDFELGARVAIWTGGNGGYGSHVTVPGWAAIEHPAGLSAETVAGTVLTYLTAYQMLNRAASIPDGSTILVHPAAGTVGQALLQLGALRGLRMYGTASAAKSHLVSRTGATPIDYRTEDYALRLRAEEPDGVDAIFDGVGSGSWKKDLPLLRAGGKLIVFGLTEAIRGGRRNLAGLLSGVVGAPRTSYLTYFQSSTGVSGYQIVETLAAHHEWYREDMGALLQLVVQGRITPVIHKTFEFDQAADAHRELHSGSEAGKILLVPGGPRV